MLYCRTCGKRFAATQTTAFFGMHLTTETIQAIIHHAAEGVGVRATARLLGLDKNLVNRAILRAGEHCAAVLSSLLRSLSLTEVQLDELWAFVKKQSGSEADEGEYGQKWIWTATDAPTRLLITFWIGGREMDDARKMLDDLVARFTDKPLFTSDELSHYAEVLAQLFHTMVAAERTGKRGRPMNPVRVVDEDLDYAIVHKIRAARRVVKVERKVIYGNAQRIQVRLQESPSKTINIAYVERTNLDWRLWDAHLVRKAPTFARSQRWLKAKFAICVTVYNFVRPHSTLSRREDRTFDPKTPAMAAGITERPWKIIDLLALPVMYQ